MHKLNTRRKKKYNKTQKKFSKKDGRSRKYGRHRHRHVRKQTKKMRGGGHLHDAIRKGNLNKVKELLRNETNQDYMKKKDINKKEHGNGPTPLVVAIKTGNANIVEFLLNKSAEINVDDIMTAVENAGTTKDENDYKNLIVKYLLNDLYNREDETSKNKGYLTEYEIMLYRVFTKAIDNNNVAIVKTLIEIATNITPFIKAPIMTKTTRSGYSQYEIKTYDDPEYYEEVIDEYDVIPLYHAATTGKIEIVKLILDNLKNYDYFRENFEKFMNYFDEQGTFGIIDKDIQNLFTNKQKEIESTNTEPTTNPETTNAKSDGFGDEND